MEETEHKKPNLSGTSVEALGVFMDEAEDKSVFGEILATNKSRDDVVKMLYEHSRTSDEVRTEAARMLNLPVPSEAEVEKKRALEKEKRDQQPQEQRKMRLAQRVERLSVSEKIKIAVRGNSEVRGVLLKDSSKLVVLAVLGNPRITESEVESAARSRSVMEEALREIARNREWMRSYKVQHALVTNPKTPAGIAVRYVPYMKKNDLKLLEKNKNVSEAVRAMAKKIVKGRGN
jgi:hypothetical protein